MHIGLNDHFYCKRRYTEKATLLCISPDCINGRYATCALKFLSLLMSQSAAHQKCEVPRLQLPSLPTPHLSPPPPMPAPALPSNSLNTSTTGISMPGKFGEACVYSRLLKLADNNNASRFHQSYQTNLFRPPFTYYIARLRNGLKTRCQGFLALYSACLHTRLRQKLDCVYKIRETKIECLVGKTNWFSVNLVMPF